MLFFLQPSIFFSILPFLILIVSIFKWFSATQRNPPPSPPKLPIIGHLHKLGLSPHRSLQTLAKHHGPLMLLCLGRVPTLIVSSASAAQEIMKTHDKIFSNRPKLSIPTRLLYDSKDLAFAPYGEYWRQVKSMAVGQLLSNKRVQSFRNLREEETALMIEKIRKASSSSLLVNLSDIFVVLTNDVVCRVAFGRKYSEEEGGRKFMGLLEDFAELLGVFRVGDYIPWLGWVDGINGLDGRVEKVAKGFDEFLEDVVKEHMDRVKFKGENSGGGSDEGEGKDFVDILLQIQRENMTGFPIQRDTIKALILDMFAAGTDTTFTLLEWAMAELIKHPKAVSTLQKEVREKAQSKSKVTEDDLERMHYLKAVIKETLRLHSPIPLLVPRESTQDVKIMGFDITAQTQVIINAWAIGRDPSFWEEAEEFKPERFLNCSVDFRGFHFELIPFGAGRRGCPGTQFAIAINELALANVVHQFEIALAGGARVEDLDMTETTGISVRKKSPLFVTATAYY